MKEALKRHGALALALIIISAVCLMFSYRKSGMFIDEIYTYGLSNSHYAPFLGDVKDGDLVDKLMTRQELLDYVMVNPGEGFDFGSVYYNQVNDVHPPLYYWLFNIASSLTPGVFSKWTGLILDYLIFLGALFCLYRLVLKLFGSVYSAVAAVCLYGLSGAGLSTMLMIRMYVLLTALTLLLALLVLKLMREKELWLCPLVGLCVFLGLMTQYYFVFYAFFLCGVYVIYALVKKEYKSLGLFCLCAVGGVLLLPLVFPACISHLFAENLVSGATALENIKNISQYPGRIMIFLKGTLGGLKAGVYLSMALAVVLLFLWGRLARAKQAGRLRLDALLLIAPAVAALILIALISPVSELRYVYNLMPIFALVPALFIHLLEESLGGFPRAGLWKNVGLLCVMGLSLLVARSAPPQYLYPEYRDYDLMLAPYQQSPCVYMTDNFFQPITQDLLQLMNFEEFFMTDRADSPALREYLAGHGWEECVVYIDTSAFWSSGFVPEEMLPELIAATDYTGWEPLYSNQLSAAFLLTKNQ